MEKEVKVCSKCNKPRIRFTKGVCHNCYRKHLWDAKLITCKRCNREMRNHAFGFCKGCYSSVFNIDYIRTANAKYYHNIDGDLYKKLTAVCVVCGFDKIVEIHHLDHNHKNNSSDNLAGLCPNCHKLLHHRAYSKEILSILKEKGFKVKEGYADDEFYKKQATPTIHKKRFESEA